MLREISIEITRKCPNNCVHCSSLSDFSRDEYINFEIISQVIKDASELNVQTICLSGGEPFLHKDFQKIVMLIAEHNMNCYIYTSGIIVDESNKPTYISKDIFNSIAKYINKLIFNIESASAKTYDQIMGTKNCFDLMKQSVLNANSLNITTEAHFVPMKLNKDEILDVIYFCRELKISKLSFLRLVMHGRAELNEQLISIDDDDLNKIKRYLIQLKEDESNIDIRIGVPLSTESQCHVCEAANGKLNIKYDGNVYPCEVFKNKKMAARLSDIYPDNIYDNSLIDIYKNSEYLNHIRDIENEYERTKYNETCLGQYLINQNHE